MKYSQSVTQRAALLYKQGVLTQQEYKGTILCTFNHGDPTTSKYHVCWYKCVNDRDDWWQCEECAKWDNLRRPSDDK